MITERRKRNRKLLDYQVRILREMHRAKYPQKFTRALFGISTASYRHIVGNGSYKEIQ